MSVTFPHIRHPLYFNNLCVHLFDEDFEHLLALLVGKLIDIMGVLFAIGLAYELPAALEIGHFWLYVKAWMVSYPDHKEPLNGAALPILRLSVYL